jgi:hypothetical protein
MNRNLVAVLALAVCPLLTAQEPLPAAAPSQEQETLSVASRVQAPEMNTAAQTALLDGTAVKLRISQTISSEEAKTGQEVAFEVIEDVNVAGVTVIHRGDAAFGSVTNAAPKKMMGRGGKLDLGISYVRLVDQEKVPLRGSKDTKGHGSTVGMTVGIATAAVLFFPAAPFFLLMHGKDVTIPQGTEITAFVQGDMRVDLANFGVAAPTGAVVQSATAPAAAALASLAVDSNPSGAEIEIAGAFVGSTPSTVSVPPGSYQLAVVKKGYSTWTRTLDVRGGAVHVTADLEEVVAAR